MISDRLRKQDAEELGKAVGTQLGLSGLETLAKTEEQLSPELERQIAWVRIKEMIATQLLGSPPGEATASRTRGFMLVY
jgi:hypothetical protein